MWGNMINKAQLDKISKIQNQCVATLDKNLSVNDTYKNYKLLKFEDMITDETNKLWHKQHLSLLPVPLKETSKLTSRAWTYQSHMITIPETRPI